MRKKELEQLVEVWKVLEILTVSLDRMGNYWLTHSEDAAKDALHEFVNTKLFEKISDARSLVVSMLEDNDSAIIEHLEKMSEDESNMGYWDGTVYKEAKEPQIKTEDKTWSKKSESKTTNPSKN